MADKLIKDPIYGYVTIQYEYINDIIDSAPFQRLRHIKQTSYSSLYPASVHNRFIHSIGVYHLGKLVIDSLLNNTNLEEPVRRLIEECQTTFILACLLHDIGHAPFSHSGEDFYLLLKDAVGQPIIYNQLIEIVDNEQFSSDVENIHKQQKYAKAHEIMSVIIALDFYTSRFIDEWGINKDLFARCITGYKYSDNSESSDIKNCLIGLLNSSIIDVDKLDYIIRDTYMTGFSSTTIDYRRLFNGINIVKDDKSHYVIAYHKNALSVIENVIYANDSEKKWIQGHPVIMYESKLIQYQITKAEEYYQSLNPQINLLSKAALCPSGLAINDELSVKLLTDDDIIYITKNINCDNITNQYFSRNMRLHPVWKTEAEYNSLIVRQLGTERIKDLEETIVKIEKKLSEDFNFPILNDNVLSHYKKEVLLLESNTELRTNDKQNLLAGYNKIIKWLNCLCNYANLKNIDFEFTIISANQFSSGFAKLDFNNLLISFPALNKCNYLKEVQTVLSSAMPYRDKMFYLYYKPKKGSQIDAVELTNTIFRECVYS